MEAFRLVVHGSRKKRSTHSRQQKLGSAIVSTGLQYEAVGLLRSLSRCQQQRPSSRRRLGRVILCLVSLVSPPTADGPPRVEVGFSNESTGSRLARHRVSGKRAKDDLTDDRTVLHRRIPSQLTVISFSLSLSELLV
jgi:hypothetical protein